ncbi:MAG: M48 family metallopeptidase [Actinomycetota bacterium]|nr:M48 family metallopeptidase [Acidimicrobiia bacterium]MDQ3146567.1 M48 family metallopeptidase [Actinomycetota bacterium]
MQVEVRRSPRRRKTVSARQQGGVLQISIPAALSPAEERHWVDEMVRRFERRAPRRPADGDLVARAEKLALRHGLPRASSIRWVDNQRSRWGSATPATGTIRISSRLAGFPDWVLDYVIVHELAHLVEAGHGPAFDALVQRYPRAERAIGYLMAVGLPPESGATPPPPRPAR